MCLGTAQKSQGAWEKWFERDSKEPVCESRVEMFLENTHGEQELEVSFSVGPGYRTEFQCEPRVQNRDSSALPEGETDIKILAATVFGRYRWWHFVFSLFHFQDYINLYFLTII